MKIGEIYNEVLGEEYPSSWSLDEFKKQTSFKKRVMYCNTHLKRITSGSSRIIYKIDDEKVLKLARNKRGLAQNEIEASYSKYYDIQDILAKVFEYDQNDLWIEMELARMVTPEMFEKIIGVSFENYSRTIYNYWLTIDVRNRGYKGKVDSGIETKMWESEFCSSIFTLISDYNILPGDLNKINSYGLVHRNGEDEVVLIDYGLTNDVWTSYYT